MKTIVVTGASSGIGKAIYQHYKEKEGWKAIGVSRKGPDYEIDLSRCPITTVDVESVDLLINAAGIMPFQENGRTMAVNFWGTYNMIQSIVPIMPEGSLIINISSVSGIRAEPELPIYAASKAAVISLTKSFAKRYAPKIRVNCISPGLYKTNLVPGDTPQELLDNVPLGFADEPYNMIKLIEMLWEYKYITGANFIVDGGLSL